MISVCMATFNGERFIAQQIASILMQLDLKDELVISDDGSTDSTLSIINTFNDSRIKVFINQKAHGYTPNFENALEHSKGDIIFLSDQDDIWLENKVERTEKEFQKGADFVYSDCITVDENLNHLQESRIDGFKIKKGAMRTLIKLRYLGCCYAFNRRVLDASLPFPKNYKALPHDAWIVSIANFFFKVSIIKEPLMLYRRHGDNVSNGGYKTNKNIFSIVYKRIYRIFELLLRSFKTRKAKN